MGLIVKRILSCLVIVILLTDSPLWAREDEDFFFQREKIAVAEDLGIITKSMSEELKNDLKREDASVILFNLFSYLMGEEDMEVETVLRDTKFKAANGAYFYGLMDGHSESIFGSSLSVKKEEFAWYIFKTIKSAGSHTGENTLYISNFSDRGEIDPKYSEAVSYLANYGIIDSDDEEFFPKANITMEEAVYMSVNVCEFFSEKYVEAKGKRAKIGMKKEEFLGTFGRPDKTSLSEYGSEKYVYLFDTGYFSASVDSQGEVEEIFTNCTDFKYYNIDSKTTAAELKHADPQLMYKYRMSDNNTYTTVYFDGLSLKADGVFVRSNKMQDYVLKMDEAYNFAVKEELVDIINCSRKRYGLDEYALSEAASEVEGRQCGYMSMKSELTHNYAGGLDFLGRFSEKGISFLKASENLAVNTLGAADIFYYWASIPGMRSNLYSSEFKTVGVGCVVMRNIIYAAAVFYM